MGSCPIKTYACKWCQILYIHLSNVTLNKYPIIMNLIS